MNGRASFNIAYDHTPVRQPSAKNREFTLSAEAPEFVPQFHKLSISGPEMSTNIGPPIQQPYVQQQQQQPHHQQHHHYQQLNQHNLQHSHNQNHHQHNHQQHNNHHHHHHHHNMNQNQNHSVNQRLNQHNNYSVQNRLQYNNGSNGGGGRQSQQQQQQQHYHQQSRVNSNHHQPPPQPPIAGGEGGEAEPSEAEMHALSFLIEIMEKLNNDPGKFEDFQKELTTLYIEFSHNQHVMSNAIELIFVQSINEQNFRYTGARLCRLLDGIDPNPDSVFRRLLCCKLQYNDTEIIQYMTNETHKVRNTILFLAELYIQLQNDGTRITSIASSIHNAISLLMPKLSPENVKCICQTLKLCGYELDIDFPKETEDVISQLSRCENIDVSTQRLLQSVIDLRKNRWGRTVETNVLSTPEPVVESNGKEFRNDPVFYGPDGQILSDEESAFLWNVTNYPADGYDDDEDNDPDALVNIEPEMDLEIQLAFKDFVSFQNNKWLNR